MFSQLFVAVLLSGLGAALPAESTTLDRRSDTWVASFWSDTGCGKGISPGQTSGSGTMGCTSVSDVYCMTGSTDVTSGLWVIGYSNSDCTGDQTHLDSGAGGDNTAYGVAKLYVNHNFEAIQSYQIAPKGT